MQRRACTAILGAFALTFAAVPGLQAAEDSGQAKLSVEKSQEYGPYLTDAEGRALYLLEGGGDCYNACAKAWPPFIAPEGNPQATDQKIQKDLIGTTERRGGAAQVTYNGHALYYYAEDQGSGEATGQDLTDQWGEWYLVTPQGKPLESHHGSKQHQ